MVFDDCLLAVCTTTLTIYIRTLIGMDHYFMGAYALHPTPSFSIKSMSSHPIIFDPSWYEGAWGGKGFSYVVYPRSIVLDDDGEHLYLSIGYQDKHTYVVKLRIDGILDSLVPCN
jgi:hypothetical protein